MKWYVFIGVPLWFITSSLNQKNTQHIEPSEIEFCLIDDALLDSGGVQALYGIRFQLGSAGLLDSNNTCILAMADYLQRNSELVLEVSTHTDCRGSNLCCWNKSLARAKSVRDRLIKLGVNGQRIIAQGYGETKPIILNGIQLSCDYIVKQPKGEEQENLHALNRRIEIKIISKDFNP